MAHSAACLSWRTWPSVMLGLDPSIQNCGLSVLRCAHGSSGRARGWRVGMWRT